ncbi:transposase [Rhizobium sp. CF122]|nr:transposase [Rhizobium sp. CF122]
MKGKWVYLYRAVDKHGETIEFYLSPTRNAKAAKRLLGKALTGLKDWEKPQSINTDKAPTYGIAIAALQARPQFAEACRRQEVRLDGIQPLGSRLGAVNSMLKAMFAMPLEKMGWWL